MNEIQNANAQARAGIEQYRKKIAAENPELWMAVVTVLGLFQKAGIVQQSGSKFNIDDPASIAFYVKDCLDLGVAPLTLLDHHDRVRRSLKFWPTSGEFAAAFAGQRSSGAAVPSSRVGYRFDPKNGAVSVCDINEFDDWITNDEAAKLQREWLNQHRVTALIVPQKTQTGRVLLPRIERVETTDDEARDSMIRLADMKRRLEMAS